MRAQLALLDGDAPRAVELISSSIHDAYAQREFVDIIIALQPIAMGTLQVGDPELGATLIGISAGEAERYGIMRPASMSQVTGVEDPTRPFVEALGVEGFGAAVERGRRLTLADAVDLLESQATRLSAAHPVASD